MKKLSDLTLTSAPSLHCSILLFLLVQDKFGSPSEEAGGAGAGWAAEKAPGSVPHPETEGWGAEGWWLWEDQWAGSREWWCGLQSVPQTLWPHHGKKGEGVRKSSLGMVFMEDVFSLFREIIAVDTQKLLFNASFQRRGVIPKVGKVALPHPTWASQFFRNSVILMKGLAFLSPFSPLIQEA